MKRRILTGLAPLFILFLAVGIYAILLFAKLGNSVNVILRENFRSVIAGQQMKESSERLDSALLFSLGGEEERGRELYAQNFPEFLANFNMESRNITLPGEKEIVEKVDRLHARYAELAEAFWETKEMAARQRLYFVQLLPIFTEIRGAAQEIIRMNEENMVEADRKARNLAARSIDYMVGAILLGLGIGAYFAYRFQRSLLGLDPGEPD